MDTFDVGAKLLGLWRAENYRDCEILERRELEAGGFEYYVHFAQSDRRLDKWLPGTSLKQGSLPTAVVPASPSFSTRRSRRDKRKYGELPSTEDPEHNLDPTELALEKEHEEKTKVKNLDIIQIGEYEVQTWYYSPYPKEYRNLKKLFCCAFCLKYMKKLKVLHRHKLQCQLRHPPGTEIYRDGGLSVFEVDGAHQKIYCQCLCLLAKLFIDHKTLYYDVEPFLFYILCRYTQNEGYHIVGYFSKEKNSAESNNVACILTFPQYQRRGYGKFLIEFSYEISKLEGKVGSPEKPLSDLGRVSYRSYWTRELLKLLRDVDTSNIGINQLSLITCIKKEDIIYTLQHLGLVRYCKGQHVICVTPKLIEQHEKFLHKSRITLHAEKITWVPPDFSTSGKKKRGASDKKSSTTNKKRKASSTASTKKTKKTSAGKRKSKKKTGKKNSTGKGKNRR